MVIQGDEIVRISSGPVKERAPTPRAGSTPDRVILNTLKMIPDASLLSVKHIRIGLASLSSQTLFVRFVMMVYCARQ